MLVEAPVVEGDRVSTAVHSDDGISRQVSYTLSVEPPEHPEDAYLAAALMPAMALREPLRMELPISERLLSTVPAIQDILAAWAHHAEVERGTTPAYERVPVQATPRRPARASQSGAAASFFTAGVDSFYTALKHRDELTSLIYVHGFDVPLDAPELRALVGEGVRQAAAELGLPLIEVETDVRSFSERCLYWEDFHGSALASVALLLSSRFSRVYVPATMTYAMLNPLGSHPLLDPLWSTENMELVHDGCEATRRHKLRVLADCEPARRWLRVCWENRGGAYNCGQCEKCLRTQAELRLLGLSQAFASLPEIALSDLEQVAIRFGGAPWRAALRAAEAGGNDPELADVIRGALRRHRLNGAPGPDVPSNAATSPRLVDDLELLATAAATVAERDRLATRVREVEGTLEAIRGSRAWRTATRLRRIRAAAIEQVLEMLRR
ncbi:MAG: hypothetical protein QOK25_1967 [Thermoleophilaceae bacterium]|nr:hypothetical protein [Thermoleophilaceae bacterium]